MAIWVNRWRRDLDKITTPRLAPFYPLGPDLGKHGRGGILAFRFAFGSFRHRYGLTSRACAYCAPKLRSAAPSSPPAASAQTMAAPRLGRDRKFIELNRLRNELPSAVSVAVKLFGRLLD
jgi:hypothetical protein